MTESNTIDSKERDYILSCALLFDEIGFPKSSFIQMIGHEYSEPLFALVNERILFIKGDILTYPKREKRKKRIDINAQIFFFNQIIATIDKKVEETRKENKSLAANRSMLLTEQSSSQPEAICISVACRENQNRKYHNNKEMYFCATLNRMVKKIPLDVSDLEHMRKTLTAYYFECCNISF